MTTSRRGRWSQLNKQGAMFPLAFRERGRGEGLASPLPACSAISVPNSTREPGKTDNKFFRVPRVQPQGDCRQRVATLLPWVNVYGFARGEQTLEFGSHPRARPFTSVFAEGGGRPVL